MLDAIKRNIAAVRERVARAAADAGKRESDILIVAAAKTVEPERINFAIEQGITNIGENRVQEFADKYGHVDKRAVWHFIGHLQTNKVKYIIDRVALIHSVESERLLDEIEKRAAGSGITARVLIEVNASGEDTKFGIAQDEVLKIIENNEKRANVKIEGLMTIGPNTPSENEIKKVFRKLYKLFLDIEGKKYNNSIMKYLSMGMSGDYELAIREGSNMIRLGSAIFGERVY